MLGASLAFGLMRRVVLPLELREACRYCTDIEIDLNWLLELTIKHAADISALWI